jgi:hypothetical protein
MYLEFDTTSGNVKVGIMKFIVTTRPLQFTHCTEIRYKVFAALPLKINCYFYFQ